jgi:hypothetical protein
MEMPTGPAQVTAPTADRRPPDRATDREQLSEFKHFLTQTVATTVAHARRRELHLRIMDALADTAQVEVLARHAVLGEAWEPP